MSAENFEEFLGDVSKRDSKPFLKKDYVFPGADVSDRLKKEIAKKARCKVAVGSRDWSKLPRRLVSASPRQFVFETIRAVSEVVGELKQKNAKSFDLIFSNPTDVDPTMHYPDQVRLLVWFTTEVSPSR